MKKAEFEEVRRKIDLKEYAEISEIKKLYDSVKERKITSMRAIQCLERVTGCEFSCTKDFCNKMESFLEKHYYCGVDLRRAMNQNGMKHSDLANMFGVSINTVKKMLTSKKPLSQDAIEFIKAVGFEKTVPLKKMKKTSSEANRIQNPKNDKIPPEKKLENVQVSDKIECGASNKGKDESEVTKNRKIEYIREPNEYRKAA